MKVDVRRLFMHIVSERTLSRMFQASRESCKENSPGPVIGANNNIQVPNPNRVIQILPGQRKLNFNGQLDGVYPLTSHGLLSKT